MIVVIVFGILVAMALALVIARFAPNPRAVELAMHAPADRRPRLSATTLRALVVELLGALGLSIIEEEVVGDERRLIAANTGDPELAHSRYVVFIEPQPPGDVVTQETVVELSESVKGERAASGMLITPATIEREGLGGLEVPIELIDGNRLNELVTRYLPGRVDELRRYRGFGPAPAPITPSPLPT